MRIRNTIIAAFLSAVGVGAANAADLPSISAPRAPAPVFTTWEFSVTGYAWASGLNGTLATVPPLPPIGVDLTFVDIL